jgi:hypothetical protein
VALPFKVASSSQTKPSGIIQTCTTTAYTVVHLAKLCSTTVAYNFVCLAQTMLSLGHDCHLHCCAPGQIVLHGCRLHYRAPGQIVPWDVLILQHPLNTSTPVVWQNVKSKPLCWCVFTANTCRWGARCSTSHANRSDRFGNRSGWFWPRQTDEGSSNVAREGSVGAAHAGLLYRIGRPPRAPSDIAEMKEEQPVLDWKSLEQINIRKGKTVYWYVFCQLDPLNRSWPFIFIGWGGLGPQENIFTSLI